MRKSNVYFNFLENLWNAVPLLKKLVLAQLQLLL